MAAPEKHHKIRQPQPAITLEKKINRNMPTGAVRGMPLHGLNQHIGNRRAQRLFGKPASDEQLNVDRPVVQRATTTEADANSPEQAKAVFEKAMAAYEAVVGRRLSPQRVLLYNAVSACSYLAHRFGVAQEEKCCGRTLVEDLAWTRSATLIVIRPERSRFFTKRR